MFHTCELCKRKFDSLRGLNIHRGSCKRKKLMYIRRSNGSINDSRSTYDDEKIETTTALLEADVLQIEHENVIQPYLPSFTTAVNLAPDLNINGITGDVYETEINNAFNEIIKWRKNIFMLPSGKAGKAFINGVKTSSCSHLGKLGRPSYVNHPTGWANLIQTQN